MRSCWVRKVEVKRGKRIEDRRVLKNKMNEARTRILNQQKESSTKDFVFPNLHGLSTSRACQKLTSLFLSIFLLILQLIKVTGI